MSQSRELNQEQLRTFIKVGGIIGIIGFTHGFINLLEKRLVVNYYGISRRPCNGCENSVEFKCLGMPSGHTEFATICASLLLFANYINVPIYIFVIMVMGLQRIITKRHTLEQVIAGYIIGTVYSVIYIYYTSYYCNNEICWELIAISVTLWLTYYNLNKYS